MPLTRRTAERVARLRREASFVFDGIVEREAASSLSIVPPGPGTVVVRIGRIYHAPGDLSDQAGQEVTVIFANEPSPAANGQRIVFFAEPFAYGETIGVRAVGTIAAADDPESLQEAVGRLAVTADDPGRIVQGLAGQRQRSTIKQHGSPW